MKKIIIFLGSLLLIVSLLVIGNKIPTWNLKTPSMQKIEGKWVDVYYEQEKDAAADVFALADSQAEYLTKRLGFTTKQNVTIYIYDKQSTMQTKKHGLRALLYQLDWYIGDNIGTNVILTSPANPGKLHSYEDVKDAVCHEMVHAYVSVLNPNIDLWLTEGMALYLSNGQLFNSEFLNQRHVPTFEETKSQDPLTFEEAGGYSFAHVYIAFLNDTYGWNAVLNYIKGGSAEDVFHKSETELYQDWIVYMKKYNQTK